jgi:valyl-tRNA synthetase
MNLDGYDPDRFADRTADGPDSADFDLPERWILSRVQRATTEVNNALDDYRIADAAQAVYHFVWDEVCDWYIELAKGRLAGDKDNPDSPAAQNRWKVQGALVKSLEAAMRLLHPFMPFLTEEIWQKLPKPLGAPQSIMITLYPIPDVRFLDESSEASMALVQKVITTIRSLRTERGIPSSVRSHVILNAADDYKKTILDGYQSIIAEHGRCREITVRRVGEPPSAPVVTAVAGDVEIILLLENSAQDSAAERAKLEKERGKLTSDRDYLTKKLANPQVIARAPAAVIEKDRARLAEVESALGRIDAALARLGT